ncbi:pilin [Rhodanobacter sp. T12-5]|uniref:pilin n=1 Tax=Rhodanobacter sp. T12-5 TaxID=2024611 RepID=UPI0011EFA1A4|nr:pilin [Rhodanobacter sp. T12-5]KAA0071282.1 pilin [Rhodanobacter sp. T12-5]
MKRPSGFTLIELMITVAIIATLTSLAITTYTQSIAKAQISEALTVTDGLKADVLNYYRQTGKCPVQGISGGLASSPASYSGKYVASVGVTTAAGSCIITATMRSASVAPALRGKQVTFTMTDSSTNSTHWLCSSDAAAVYVPQTCR